MKHPQSYGQTIEAIKSVHPHGELILDAVMNGDTHHVKDHVEDFLYSDNILTDLTNAIAKSIEFQEHYLGQNNEESEDFGQALRETYAPILLAILSNPQRFAE